MTTDNNRERMESPERTAAILSHLVTEYGADSVQFYDMNFFLREDHALELAKRIEHLKERHVGSDAADGIFCEASFRATVLLAPDF